MKYNDYIEPSERDYKLMKQNYDELINNETADLEEILNKMQNQWNNLKADNVDGKYDEILDKLQGNIDELSGIIENNKSNIFGNNITPNIPIPLRPKLKKLDTDTAISPIRSWDEMSAHSPSQTLPNTDTNLDDIINIPSDPIGDIISPSPALPNDTNSPSISPAPSSPISPSLPNMNDDNQAPNTNTPTKPTPTTPIQNDNAQNSTNTLKRNSPMQSNALFTTFKRFNVNLNRIFRHSYKSQKRTQNNSIYKDKKCTLYTQNRYHHSYRPDACLPPVIFYDNQIDIIRLMLLYLMLRPNCKYMSRIAKLTNEQFDILIGLKTI